MKDERTGETTHQSNTLALLSVELAVCFVVTHKLACRVELVACRKKIQENYMLRNAGKSVYWRERPTDIIIKKPR